MIKLNEQNIEKRKKDLTYFKGFLPFQFDSYISFTDRKKFLQKIGLWETVNREDMKVNAGMRQSSDMDLYLDRIFKKWLSENPQFEDVVLED